MTGVNGDLFEAAILARASFINTVILAGVLLAATISLVRFSGSNGFKILDVSLPVGAFPAACVCYTLAHAYCTWLFASLCWSAPSSPDAWRALTLKGPLIFNGMLPRETLFALHVPRVGVVPFDAIRTADPTLWLFYGFCTVVFFAFRWSCDVAGYSKLRARAFTAVLLLSNWTLGGVWAGAANHLAK